MNNRVYECTKVYIKPRFKGAFKDAMSKMWGFLSIIRHFERKGNKIDISKLRRPLGGDLYTLWYTATLRPISYPKSINLINILGELVKVMNYV